ncbi:sensor domain-containing diguanylate cyclase [Oceanospirillum sediminis]|uniref:diguanylate cyclase n=1 Tax=Oceanospirillum sediminis TaxID=2760088 RepID=A0A839ILX1_9GAMM|nr:GGDEF domain-containing protein [Oceanospirillum sediminis]
MIDYQTCILESPHPAVDHEKWQVTVNLLAELYDAACATIVQFRQNEFKSIVASKNEDNFLKGGDSWPWELQSFCRQIMETGEKVYEGHAVDNEQWCCAPAVEHGPVRSYYGLPLFWPDQKPFGTICIIDRKPTGYNPLLMQMLEQFRDYVQADLKGMESYEQIRSLALTDELTGLFNRRGMVTLGEQRIRDARRFNQEVGIVYIDIDNLKQTNDHHGHDAGDKGLKALAELLQKNTRDADLIARMGGDEFVVMMLATDPLFIPTFCARMVDEYTRMTDQDERLRALSISYGYKFFQADSVLSLSEMIDQADLLMYQQKQVKKETAV